MYTNVSRKKEHAGPSLTLNKCSAEDLGLSSIGTSSVPVQEQTGSQTTVHRTGESFNFLKI